MDTVENGVIPWTSAEGADAPEHQNTAFNDKLGETVAREWAVGDPMIGNKEGA